MSPRISLVSDNDTTGNASVAIVSLATTDSGLYLCTVWKGCHILHQNTVIVTVLGGKGKCGRRDYLEEQFNFS